MHIMKYERYNYMFLTTHHVAEHVAKRSKMFQKDEERAIDGVATLYRIREQRRAIEPAWTWKREAARVIPCCPKQLNNAVPAPS